MLVAGHHLLDPPGDPLLDPLRIHARPGGDDEGGGDGDLRVLALGHREIADDAPHDGAHQRDPRHLPLLGEVAGSVVFRCDQRGVVQVRHRVSATASRARPGRSRRWWLPARSPARPAPVPDVRQ